MSVTVQIPKAVNPINAALNRVDAFNNQGAFKKIVGSRLTNLCVIAPLEVVAAARNILATPFMAISTVFQWGTKTVGWLSGSEKIKNFAAKIPGFGHLLARIASIFAYAIGAVLSVTLGVISPHANFRVHCMMGLATNHIIAAKKLEVELLKKQGEFEATQSPTSSELIDKTDVTQEVSKIEKTITDQQPLKAPLEEKITTVVETPIIVVTPVVNTPVVDTPVVDTPVVVTPVVVTPVVVTTVVDTAVEKETPKILEEIKSTSSDDKFAEETDTDKEARPTILLVSDGKLPNVAKNKEHEDNTEVVLVEPDQAGSLDEEEKETPIFLDETTFTPIDEKKSFFSKAAAIPGNLVRGTANVAKAAYNFLVMPSK